ncbi:MAG: hypothetical protein R2790_08825 [Flavobacterium haoranii]
MTTIQVPEFLVWNSLKKINHNGTNVCIIYANVNGNLVLKPLQTCLIVSLIGLAILSSLITY